MHVGPFVTLPQPGLFDETASDRLACIGCEDKIARSQIIDGSGLEERGTEFRTTKRYEPEQDSTQFVKSSHCWPMAPLNALINCELAKYLHYS